MSDYIQGGGSISHEAAAAINRLILKVEGLEKQVDDLQHGRTPKQEKRKTLGEIARDAYFSDKRTLVDWDAMAKAVAEAIIERHLGPTCSFGFVHDIVAAIRKEFEE